MSAIIRSVLSRKALALAGLSSLILLLALACGSASTPVGSTPAVPTATPVPGGAVQTPVEAATPTPAPTARATPARTVEVQPTDNDSKDPSDSVQRSGGIGGGEQAASSLRSGGNGGDDKAPSSQRTGETDGEDQAPAIPEKGELTYPNLGSRLDELVASVEAGEITAEQAASGAALYSGASIAVTIYLSGGVDGVVAFLEENGGDPRNVGEDHIEAYVPVILLGAASQQPGVIQVREIVPPEPDRKG